MHTAPKSHPWGIFERDATATASSQGRLCVCRPLPFPLHPRGHWHTSFPITALPSWCNHPLQVCLPAPTTSLPRRRRHPDQRSSVVAGAPPLDTMELFMYWSIFGVLSTIVAGLIYTQHNSGSIVPASGSAVAGFLRLRNNYVFVYALMMGEAGAGRQQGAPWGRRRPPFALVPVKASRGQGCGGGGSSSSSVSMLRAWERVCGEQRGTAVHGVHRADLCVATCGDVQIPLCALGTGQGWHSSRPQRRGHAALVLCPRAPGLLA